MVGYKLCNESGHQIRTLPLTYRARGVEGRITEALRDTPVVCL
jgi:hypothetical protein